MAKVVEMFRDEAEKLKDNRYIVADELAEEWFRTGVARIVDDVVVQEATLSGWTNPNGISMSPDVPSARSDVTEEAPIAHEDPAA